MCDAVSNYVLAPFLRLLTPTGFNRMLITVFEGKWREWVDATLLQIQMSNELCGKLMKEKLVFFYLFEKSVFYGVEFVESRRCAELRRAFIESVPRGNDSLSRPQRVVSVSNSAALFTHNLFVVLSLGRRREPSSNPPRNDPSNFERRL